MRYINVKKALVMTIDLALAVYLFFAVTSFNTPVDTPDKCVGISINIADKTTNGFLKKNDIKKKLTDEGLYPVGKEMSRINPRVIEDMLLRSSFVKEAQCYKTIDGNVNVTIRQQLPVIRIKSNRGEDYYIDERGGIMSNSEYTSDLIIASGYITRSYAERNLVHIANTIMRSELWSRQIEQIYLRPDSGIELVPRVGEHVIYIGRLPEIKKGEDRAKVISDFVNGKLERMEMFYKYGLSQAGWNKYYEINLDYDNQIICKKRQTKH